MLLKRKRRHGQRAAGKMLNSHSAGDTPSNTASHPLRGWVSLKKTGHAEFWQHAEQRPSWLRARVPAQARRHPLTRRPSLPGEQAWPGDGKQLPESGRQ